MRWPSATRRARSRAGSIAVVVALALAPWAATAAASFTAAVAATGGPLATYTVPPPTGLACRGLLSLSSSRIVWNPVTPPPGQSVRYAVTEPDGDVVTTTATSHPLPILVLLPGVYQVQAEISSGWRSAPASIRVSLNALGLLYVCS